MFDPNGCSHGIPWSRECSFCAEISIKQEIYDLTTNINAVVSELERMPAMATSPEVIITLYRTINRLAMLILRSK
jgi:hypothetical protein